MMAFVAVSMMLMIGTLTSCHKDKKNDEPDSETIENREEVKRAVVVYAINKSSLSPDFIDDSGEMLRAMSQIDSQYCRLLVYNTINNDECGLFEARRVDGGETFSFESVKTYRRDVLSTDPARMQEVLEDALEIFPNAAYDLFFWGHGTSWRPEYSDHEIVTPDVHAYGGEYNPTSSRTDWTEIDELAAAVPDHRFETIWFDCCYMSGIENIYQLRDKCRNFVGYPTEVWQYGLAYDLVLPHIVKSAPDLLKGAQAFYHYYAGIQYPATVAVVDMSEIESVAGIAREILASGPLRPDRAGMINYSRMLKTPLYDLRQFYTLTAEANGRSDLAEAFTRAMDRLVRFHAESDRNFNFKYWDTRDISGISTHYYMGSDSPEEKYYRTLDWYKRVFE